MAKSEGKQAIKAGHDHGGHAAFSKAESPASVKAAAQGATKYKHR